MKKFGSIFVILMFLWILGAISYNNQSRAEKKASDGIKKVALESEMDFSNEDREFQEATNELSQIASEKMLIRKQPVKKVKEKKEKISLSEKEKEMLYRIVEAEATGGGKKSKQYVACVVLNRVKDKRFPNSVEKVIFQRKGGVVQFSPVADGRYEKVKITRETKNAVNDVLEGKISSKGALYFANRRIAGKRNMQWFDNNLTYLYSCGGHEYYK